MRSSLACIPLAILRVHGAMSVVLPPTPTLLDDGGWVVGAEVRTVSFAENRTSRDPRCFPMETVAVPLNQLCADLLALMTDSAQ